MTLTPEGYRKRLVDEQIDTYLNIFGAVSIEGPKWSGKTWTARNHCNSEFLMDSNNKSLLSANIAYAFNGETPRLIDEWQDYPELWDETRFEVDRSNRKGRFILCGSSTIKQEHKKHTGAGRIGTVTMHTMSLLETGDSDGAASIKDLFENKPLFTEISKITLDKLIDLTIRGGWPGLINSDTNPEPVIKDYLDKLCNKDISEIDGRNRSPHKMKIMLKSLARNESTIVSDTAIRKDMAEYGNETISDSTVDDYRTILERLGILWYQPAFKEGIRSAVRVGKSPKKHLADPSLAMSLLGMNKARALSDLETFGFIFESLCERDLKIYSDANGYRLYHYRDSKNREIDAIIERGDGEWGAFEIKLGFGQVENAVKRLQEVSKNFDKKPKFLCVLCGTAPAAYIRPDGVYVVPITRLGP